MTGTNAPQEGSGTLPLRFAPYLFVAGIFAFGLLLFTVREIVYPLVVSSVALLLLIPLRHERYVRPLIWAVALVTLGWIIFDVWTILVPFCLAFLFAFLFDPLVVRLSSRMPRWVSAMGILIVLIGIVVIVGMFLVPPTIIQLQQLLANVSTIVRNITSWYTEGGLSNMLRAVNLPEDKVKSFLGDQLAPHVQTILEAAFAAILTFVSSGTYVLGQVVNIVLMPFLSFYLLKDFPELRAGTHRLLEAFHAPSKTAKMLSDIEELVSNYVRGQVFVASITGTLAAIIFVIGGVPFAVLLGLMIAVLDVVPYVGLIANMTFSSIVVLLGPDPSASKVVFVVAVILGLNLLETNVIAPRIIGQTVRLHPVMIILSIFVFSHLFGILGLLIAVPTTGVAAYLGRTWLETRTKNTTKEIV